LPSRSPCVGIDRRLGQRYDTDMKSEELLRYQAMYREIERALKTRLLTFGFVRTGPAQAKAAAPRAKAGCDLRPPNEPAGGL